MSNLTFLRITRRFKQSVNGIKLNWNHNTQGYPYEMDGTRGIRVRPTPKPL